MSKPLRTQEVAKKLTNGGAKELARDYIAMMKGIQKKDKEHVKAMRDYITKYNKSQKSTIEAIMTKNKQDTDELQAIIELMTEDKRLEGKLKHVYARLDKVAKSRAKADEWANAEMPELPEFVKQYDEEVPIKAALKARTVVVVHDDSSDDDGPPKPKATGASSSVSASFKAAPKVAKSSMAAASDGAAGVPADFKRPSGKAPAAPQAPAVLDELGFC